MRKVMEYSSAPDVLPVPPERFGTRLTMSLLAVAIVTAVLIAVVYLLLSPWLLNP